MREVEIKNSNGTKVRLEIHVDLFHLECSMITSQIYPWLNELQLKLTWMLLLLYWSS
jgi:hypothetical protein